MTEIEKKIRLSQWLFEQKRFDQARTWLDMALKAAAEAKQYILNHEEFEAQILSNFVLIDFAEKKWADAVPRLRRAIEIYDKLNLPDPMPLAHVLAKLIMALGYSQQLDDAETAALRLVGFVEQRIGRETPQFANAIGSLGTIYFQKGKGTLSLQLCTQQLQLLERLHGPESAEVANNQLNMAHLLRWMRRPDDAAACERRAKEIEAKLPPSQPKPSEARGPLQS